MCFLRLGVACAVRDDEGRILLSKRGDLNVWNLPSGRLDRHELLTDAALREVYEETGIHAEIIRLVGLYYYQGWERMNILFEARSIGGTLQQVTSETLANRFFASDELPQNNISEQMVYDVLNQIQSPLRVVTMQNEELQQTKRKLRWRWVKNLLHGHLEPRYPRFLTFVYHEPYPNARLRVQVNGNYPMWGQIKLGAEDKLTAIEHDIEADNLIFRFGKNDTGFIQYQHKGEGK